MLQLTPHMRLLLAVEPVDFRRGIDGLSAVCTNIFKQDPYSGSVFVFTNRAKTSVKLLVYDGQGFWLMHKRFSQGKLKWWPKSQHDVHSLQAHELLILLRQGNPENIDIQKDWKPLLPNHSSNQ